MQIPPMSVLETLPAPNYINPVEHAAASSIVNLIFFPLCVLVMALRIYSRVWVSKSFGVDDTLALIAMLPAAAFCVISVLAELHYGWTCHAWDVPPESISLGLQLILTAECLFAAGCTLTKLSMLWFVRRMLNHTHSVVSKVAVVAMVIIGGQGLTFCFIVVFQCNPISDYWRLTFDAQPNCFNQPANLLAAGIVNTLTDIAVVALPIPIVLKLKLPMRQQLIMVMLFAAGFLVCVAGCVRTYYMYMVSQTYDQTWEGYKVWLTGALELYLAILCCSLPALKPLFSKYMPHFLGTLQSINSSKRRSTRIMVTTTSTVTRQSAIGYNLGESPLASPIYDGAFNKKKLRMSDTEIHTVRSVSSDSHELVDLESQFGGLPGLESRRGGVVAFSGDARAQSSRSERGLIDARG